MGHRSWQKICFFAGSSLCSCILSSWVALFFRAYPRATAWGPPRTGMLRLPPPKVALVPGAPPPSPSLALASAGFFLSYFSHSCLTASEQYFYLFLNMLLQQCHQPHWWAQLCPVVGQMEWTGTGCVYCRRGPPLQCPSWQNLPHKPNALGQSLCYYR